MKRLTKKLPNGTYTSTVPLTNNGSSRAWLFQLGKKLGQIEDIEDELGIELITLIKAMKDGIYAYDHANNIDHMEILSTFYGTRDMECRTDFDGDIFEYDFADYGKTWALTKEELEK